MASPVFLVRHGAVAYHELAAHAPVYDGGRYDLAPLSDKGVRQVEHLVPELGRHRGGMVVSSPYTRALQTAAILAGALRCQLTVDLALHDWLPVRDGSRPMSAEIVAAKIAEYDEWKTVGTLPLGRTWETDDEMRVRLRAAVARHRGGKPMLIVTHEVVIKSAIGIDEVPLASYHPLYA